MPTHSPVIFWLLLAATLSVDSVAAFWFRRPPVPDARTMLFFALAFSQISVVLIASIFAERPALWRWFAPLAAATAAAALLSLTNPDVDAGFYFTATIIFVLHMVAMTSTLLVLRQRRLTDRRWQFSLRHVLVVMTVTALLITASQATEMAGHDWYILAALIADSALVAAAVMVGFFAAGHWALRLGAVLGIALLAGWGLNLADFPGFSWDCRVFNLIQAGVIVAWLSLGHIVPPIEFASNYQEEAKTARTPPM